jgi:hypothetical protein
VINADKSASSGRTHSTLVLRASVSKRGPIHRLRERSNAHRVLPQSTGKVNHA